MAMSSRVAAPAMRQLGLRVFSTPAIGSARASPVWMAQMRNSAFASSVAGDEPDKKGATAAGSDGSRKDDKGFASYWGVSTPKITKPDGTEWKWACFKPGDTYSSDLSIDLKKHHVPTTWGDKLAQWTVKALRLPTDLFFKKRYGCRAMMLETVAAVPGMVGGMLLHCKSLRRFEQSGGWIRALLEEAENERMHLMTFMEVSQPKWYERALVIAVQGVFFNVYFVAYLISPKLAHRMVGYLEEEAIYSYTEFLKELDKGNIDNCPAPAIAIDYWRLPPNATLRDVVMVVRADEAHHRDVNHFASHHLHPRRILPSCHVSSSTPKSTPYLFETMSRSGSSPFEEEHIGGSDVGVEFPAIEEGHFVFEDKSLIYNENGQMQHEVDVQLLSRFSADFKHGPNSKWDVNPEHPFLNESARKWEDIHFMGLDDESPMCKQTSQSHNPIQELLRTIEEVPIGSSQSGEHSHATSVVHSRGRGRGRGVRSDLKGKTTKRFL
ncbi:hypothetical protein J5N97_008239 [Dioscorea zingiberensis]|uniref:Ubiquinol oxidase n=1 Tax=Dioscorea zingiberensis TaxID=325984 RepID=A0A9D5HVK2_9LILI|nr:hypothetical protein J5N97_008239 [Dioscorea zingiberensis]